VIKTRFLRLAIQALLASSLAGCSTIKDAAYQLFEPVGEDNDCSLNSNPICIPIRGDTMKAEGDNFKLVDIKVGKHFKLSDFRCRCGCGEVAYTPKLVTALDDLAERFRRDVVVTSGFRCEKRNKEVGGEAGSLHLTGAAVDFVVRGVSPAKVAQHLAEWGGGLGEYDRHVHLDVGTSKRWKGKSS